MKSIRPKYCLILLSIVLSFSTAQSQDETKEYSGEYVVNETTSDFVFPKLKINGKRAKPLVGPFTDLVIPLCDSSQIWILLAEFTPWRDVNRFGIYSDLGSGLDQQLIFSGDDSKSFAVETFYSSHDTVGLWLLNDINGDKVFNGDDSYLFSERDLTVGSFAANHQWFMVYVVSEYKGQDVEYEFETKTEEFEFKGDFDYLIFIDDDHTSANFDHNDMIVGMLCSSANGGNLPPQAICPDDVVMTVCDLSPICLGGFGYFDPDGDNLSVEVIGGKLVGDSVCFAPKLGLNQLTLIVTDESGLSDMCMTTVDVVLLSSPVIEDQDFFGSVCNVKQKRSIQVESSFDVGKVSYKLLSGPGKIDPKTGVITYIPDTSGLFTFVVKANTSCGSDIATIHDRVSQNNPPRIISYDSTIIICSIEEICVPVIASDSEGDAVVIVQLEGVGEFTQLSDSLAQTCFMPADIDSATYLFVYRAVDSCSLANDNSGGEASIIAPLDTIQITVIKNRPPIIADQFFSGEFTGQIRNLPVIASDPDGEDLNYSLIKGAGTIDLGSGLITYLPDTAGVYTFLVSVKDLCITKQALIIDTLFEVDLPMVQIFEVENLSLNSPFVNINQSFGIHCRVINHSDFPIPILTLKMTSDGNSLFDSLLSVSNIAAFDTVSFKFDVTASSLPNTVELFHIEFDSDDVVEIEPRDQGAAAVIQMPANLQMSYKFFGVSNGTVTVGQHFTLQVQLRNLGEAMVEAGTYQFDGFGDPISGEIASDTIVTFDFSAPKSDTVLNFSFVVTGTPVDRNTGTAAIIDKSRFDATIMVLSRKGNLVVSAKMFGSGVVVHGKEQELFELTLNNQSSLELSTISLDEIEIILSVPPGQLLDIPAIVNLDGSGFNYEGMLVTFASAVGDRLLLSFENMQLPPESTTKLVFQVTPLTNISESFGLFLESSGIRATNVEGPFAGETIDAIPADGNPTLISQNYVTIGSNLQSSFEIKNNPFNPLNGDAQFAYFLDSPGRIEFRVFTLVGEEVFARDIPFGSPGTEVNVRQLISWDGRNNNGGMVLNGVYIAIIKQPSSGQQATMKVAVLK